MNEDVGRIGDADRAGGPVVKSIPPLDAKGVARFFSKVAEASDGCHFWQAACDRRGYGQFSIGGRLYAAHRVAFAMYYGPIKEGLVVDHLCQNKGCVNPQHIRAVDARTNNAENGGANEVRAGQTHCLRGHPLSGDNLAIKPDGSRRCRICKRASDQRSKLARRNRNVG